MSSLLNGAGREPVPADTSFVSGTEPWVLAMLVP